MFPDRFWICVGSGQMLNEGIVGKKWPTKDNRNEALKDAVHIMRELWRGKMVNYDKHFTVQNAKLYTLPPKPPVVV